MSTECLSIVLVPKGGHRQIAQKNWGLTDEQMVGMHVHHQPPKCEGGQDVPEHLYVCSPSMHRWGWHDGKFWIDKASKSSGNRNGPRGRPPRKTEASPKDIEVAMLRHKGFSRKEIAEKLGLNEGQVKRHSMQAKKFGIVFTSKSGPKKGSPQRGGNYNKKVKKPPNYD